MLINSPNISGSLNVSGNTVITGSLTTSIAALNTAATTFLTSNNGTIRSRTAAQTLSDIGAQATGSYVTVSNASNLYVPYTGATASVNLGYNSLAASNINIDGNAPTAGSYLGFKQATTVNTGVGGYTSISTFGTNKMTFSFAQPTGYKSISFTVSEITQDVSGGRVYTMPDSSGTLALTSNLGAYLPLTGGAITGSLIVTGGITGNVTGSATTASYVEYTNVANKPTLLSGSVQIRDFGIFATTGSNQFNGSQSITGSLTVSGQVIAQTLNVQQVTSSIVYSSGSNVFGNNTGNTHRFTGSLAVTGSLSVNGAGTFTGTLNGTTSIFGSPLSVNQTSKIGIGYDSGYGRINAWGADTDTYGGLSFELSHSNGGTYQAFRINPTGDVFFGSGGYYANVEAGSLRVSYATALSQALTPLNSKFVNSANNFVKIGLGQGETNPNFNSYYGIIGLDNSTTLANNKLRFYIGNADTATAGHSNDQLVIQGDGKVGIGTASPGRLFEIASGGDTAFLRVTGNRGNADGIHVGNIEFYNSNTTRLVGEVRGITGTGGTQSNSGQLAFYTNDNGTYAERLRIASTGEATFSSSVTATSGNFTVDGVATNSVLDILTLSHTTSGTAASGLGAGILFKSERPSGGVNLSRAAIYGIAGSNPDDDGDLTFYTRTDTSGAGFTEKMRITSDGNVGIGTTSPSTFLHVFGANTANRGQLSIQSNNASNGARATWYYDTTLQGEIGTTSGDFYALAANNFLFYTGGNPRMTITSGGNILINQTSAITGVSTSVEMSGVGTAAATLQASYNVYSWHGTNATWRGYLQFTKSRGTTVGSYTAVANGDDLGTVRWSGADGSGVVIGAEISAQVDGTPGVNDMPTRLVFSTTADGASSPTERMRITSAGRVGIGVTNPDAGLQVAQPGQDDQLTIGSIANNRDHAAFMCSGANKAEILRYQSATRLVIGSSANISTLDVIPGGTNGVRLSAGNTSWSAYTSDERKKKNFETVPGLEAITQINPVKYHFKTQEDSEAKKLGFTAQNIQPLIPEMVHPNGEKAEDGSDILTIIPDYILPVLVKAIQELKSENDTLKSRIDTLEQA